MREQPWQCDPDPMWLVLHSTKKICETQWRWHNETKARNTYTTRCCVFYNLSCAHTHTHTQYQCMAWKNKRCMFNARSFSSASWKRQRYSADAVFKKYYKTVDITTVECNTTNVTLEVDWLHIYRLVYGNARMMWLAHETEWKPKEIESERHCFIWMIRYG